MLYSVEPGLNECMDSKYPTWLQLTHYTMYVQMNKSRILSNLVVPVIVRSLNADTESNL